MVKNEHGLVVTGDDPNRLACAGYLFMHEGKAFDPGGYVEGVTTQEVVDAHNKILSQMEIEGLDNNCQVGQGSTFYIRGPKQGAPNEVVTWIGDLIASVSHAQPYHGGWKITFTRRGKTLEGKIRKGECCGFFTCIACQNPPAAAGGSQAGPSPGA